MNLLRSISVALAAVMPPALFAADVCTPVEVRNVRPAAGVVMLAVYDNEAQFNREPVTALKQRADSVETVRFAVCGLQGRTVALSVYQDLNENSRLDVNLFGIPSEPWGASGKPPAYSAPTWQTGQIVLGVEPVVINLSR